MANYTYRSERSPPAVVCVQNAALPLANTDLFDPIVIVGPTTKIGAFEIYFESSVSGVLTLYRTVDTTTTTITLNYGDAASATNPVGPQIITFSGGETIGAKFSATTGTYYLTIADVSGDIVKKVAA